MITTGVQLAILGGAMVGSGVAGLVWRIAPARPHPGDVVSRLAPNATPAHDDLDTSSGARTDRLGRWAMKTLPGGMWGQPPRQELALLRIPLARFYGQKLLFACTGLLIVPGLASLFAMLGWRLPVLLPMAATVALAAVMFFLPDYNVRDDAKKARTEFARALGAWTDLVALERNAGSGARQSMEVAAAIGDSWVFRRLREELALSNWTGEAPWDALKRISHSLGLPELSDVADIIRLGGEHGSQIYAQLRARSASMRAAMLNDELSQANAIGEKMSIPMSVLGAIFLLILIAPALLRVVAGT